MTLDRSGKLLRDRKLDEARSEPGRFRPARHCWHIRLAPADRDDIVFLRALDRYRTCDR